jgi:predicted metal-binding protein
MAEGQTVCLHVCVTCRAGEAERDGMMPAGRRLHEQFARALNDSGDSEWIELKEVACLVSCQRGCAAAVSMPGKWSYLLGHLDDSKTGDVLTYLRVYRESKSGAVLPSRRPASLQDAMLARFPSLTPPPDAAP